MGFIEARGQTLSKKKYSELYNFLGEINSENKQDGEFTLPDTYRLFENRRQSDNS